MQTANKGVKMHLKPDDAAIFAFDGKKQNALSLSLDKSFLMIERLGG